MCCPCTCDTFSPHLFEQCSAVVLIMLTCGHGLLFMSVTLAFWNKQIHLTTAGDTSNGGGLPIHFTNQKWSLSPDALRYLSKKEFELRGIMKLLAAETEQKLVAFREWIDDFEASSCRTSTRDSVASNPLASFRMMRRFANFKNTFVESESPTESRQLLNTFIEKFESEALWPDESDLQLALQLIIGLRFTYDLDPVDLIRGTVLTTQTGTGLSAQHVQELALYAEKSGQFTEAVFWLQALLLANLPLEELEENHKFRALLEESLKRVAEVHDQTIASENESRHRFTTKISDKVAKPDARASLQTVDDFVASRDSFFEDTDRLANKVKYNRLCRGQKLISETIPSSLICFYDRKSAPYWTINPLKIEIHSWTPLVARFYDVIGEKGIAFLRTTSANSTEEAKLSAPASNYGFRLGLASFLSESSVGLGLDLLYQKVAAMTGLEIYAVAAGKEVSEDLQIGGYAPGGLFDVHYDNLPIDVLERQNMSRVVTGDRLATFMIYLNDVQLGGGTAFPILGIAVEPIKGSALFWYNLHRNGSQDFRALHGGCPVLLGEKWVANVWIRSFQNVWKKPCSIRQDE